MSSILKKVLPVILPLLFLFAVVNFVTPPESWENASLFQIFVFFIPLLVFYTFFINLFLKYLPHSFLIALGALLLTVFWAVNQLNIITLGITLLALFLMLKIFPKLRLPRFKFFRGLTNQEKIPNISKLNKSGRRNRNHDRSK